MKMHIQIVAHVRFPPFLGEFWFTLSKKLKLCTYMHSTNEKRLTKFNLMTKTDLTYQKLFYCE